MQKLVETMTYDKNCWLDCIKLDKNSRDPPNCKLRADEGLAAIGEMSPGCTDLTSLMHTILCYIIYITYNVYILYNIYI